MTELEWLAATNPSPLLKFIADRVSGRKLRLFAAACCRCNWDILDPELARPGVEIIEQFADNLASAEQLADLHRSAKREIRACRQRLAWRRSRNTTPSDVDQVISNDLCQAELMASASEQKVLADSGVLIHSTQCSAGMRFVGSFPHDNASHVKFSRLIESDYAKLTDLLRDILGNPFRPIAIDPRWLTADVLDLSRAIYEDRAFVRLPILADALMDAGCDNAEIIQHCRGDGSHVRGCWVVDLLLGKR